MIDRGRIGWAVTLVCLSLCACTIDDPQVNEVAAVSLLTVNPLVVPQTVGLAGSPVSANLVQSTYWEIREATLFVGNDPVGYDLLYGGPCRIATNPVSTGTRDGDCEDSLILRSVPEEAGLQATLALDFTVTLKRREPLILPFVADYDGDGVLNGTDNCPLVPNPGQEDLGGFGIGDACRTNDPFFGIQLDSDADGVQDTSDNCVDQPNPQQVNTPRTSLEALLSDYIGDACDAVDQEVVLSSGGPVALTFDIVLPDTAGFILVDFNDEEFAPACEWGVGTCTSFDPTRLRACFVGSLLEAILGCPD